MNDWIMLYFRSHTNCYIRAIIYLTSDLFCSDKNNGQDRTGRACLVIFNLSADQRLMFLSRFDKSPMNTYRLIYF